MVCKIQVRKQTKNAKEKYDFYKMYFINKYVVGKSKAQTYDHPATAGHRKVNH